MGVNVGANGLGDRVSGALFIVEASSLRYVDWGTLGGALFIVPAGLFTGLLLITEPSEWARSLWRKGRKPMPRGPLAHYPKVSIHVPTYNEPPQMVMQTLNALARLDYPDYEVIVLDNNTKDPADWKPVEAHCATLGDKFRFFHFENMKGFKAGALNKALELTHPDAAYIGVIDSDYEVMPHWLKTAMPVFAEPKVGQTLTVEPREVKRLGPMLLVAATITCEGQPVATGELSLYA